MSDKDFIRISNKVAETIETHALYGITAADSLSVEDKFSIMFSSLSICFVKLVRDAVNNKQMESKQIDEFVDKISDDIKKGAKEMLSDCFEKKLDVKNDVFRIQANKINNSIKGV